MGQKATWQKRVDAALAESKLWRAKEILQGNLRTHGYDLELYERLGQVLLEMGDTLEAGKYLFLSGAREPRYAEAIELYLARYAHKALRNLTGTLPNAARQTALDSFPEAVQGELRERQVQSVGTLPGPCRVPPGGSLGGRVAKLACCAVAIALMIFVLVCAGAGLPTVLDWFLGH